MLTGVQTLITSTAAEYTTSMLVVLGIVIGIGVGFLVFRIAWRKLKGSHK